MCNTFTKTDRSITCLICNMESFNTNDINEEYCGMCKQFHIFLKRK